MALLLSSGLTVMAADQATLAQLPTMIRGARVKVTLADGTTLRSYLQGVKPGNGGALTIGVWRNRDVACREVRSITYEPSSRSAARGQIGTAIGFGFALGSVFLMANTSVKFSPAPLLAAPFAGYYGAYRLVPRRPRTLFPICP